uniref:Reverse transcriptase domain-containing protein n=1 Tax=Tanacetum cinerariifolium TaxID=118510 RepID=A0A6L2KMD4_TANCI|nr:reverse transcriptase domain-containing protein [Tanacetum cinerariifolium]
MEGLIERGGPEGADDREETPPLAKEQIKGHMSALKSLIKSHNRKNKGDHIRLDFETIELEIQGHTVVKGKEMPNNIKLYDGTTDPEDHLSRFAGAANSGEWPMPVWCRMFQQTLNGSARGWFERLPHDSINEWAELREAFAARFSVRRACFKEPHEITKITRKANESLTTFKERWTVKTDKVPATVNEMMERLDDFVRSEEAYASTELPKGKTRESHRKMPLPFNGKDTRSFRNAHRGESRRDEFRNSYRGRDAYRANRARDDRAPYPPPRGEYNRRVTPVLTLNCLTMHPKEILATETQLRLSVPRPMLNPLRSGNADRYSDYHQEKGHYTNDCIQLRKQLEMALESGKLNHLVKGMRQMGRGSHKISSKDVYEEPLIVEAEMEEYLVRRVYVDEGSSVEVRFEHCFENLNLRIKDRRTSMKFIMVRAPSPYNIILGRPGLKALRAIPSTIYSMIKFLTPKGVATLVTRTVVIAECRRLEKKQMIKGERPEEKGEVAATEEVLINPSFPDQLVTVGVFTWEPSDMAGVPRRIIEHALNVNPSLDPVCQKQRTFSTEKSGVVANQVAEWAKAGIVRLVKYPTYISNHVLIKKGDGTWRMCIDFKNLNSACPEDYYPLPNIDCATYQRLVDSAFQSQIGRNLEAYVNGMKCSFGVEEWKFLCYVVTSEGVRANPKKTKALTNLQSSRTLKEMQSLNGKLASISHFLSKSSERSLPFLNTLKNITKENNHEYRWTQEAEEAFQQMKKLITELPSLTPPREKETLYAYLVVSAKAVSAVLLIDRKGRQCLIQYVSRTLNEAERNYAHIEKLALSLIHMTRRLRRYFEAHPVKVITDQPIKNILSNTKTSRKLAKYVVELGAYNITFIPRNVVKGQVLADFLSEAPEGTKEDLYFRMPEATVEKDEVESWTLFTDGTSSPKGSGACLVLIGPSDIEYTYALHLTFLSTNNEAEYEALLAGLRIARQMNISNIYVKVDSKLVASQINKTYESSKDIMIKYLAKAREYVSGFKSLSIENIPRNMNQKAYVLSKLASVAFNHLTKEVLVEILNERSTKNQEVHTIVEEEGNNWMTPIIHCLEERTWLKDKNEARCLRAKIGQYTMKSEVLFKKRYLVPMLRCVGPLQTNYVIREIRMGSYGMHIGPRAVVRKTIRQGYYWPTMHEDAKNEAEKCDPCQIEAKPLVKITCKEVLRFAMDNIICRFGLPRVIVTKNGAQLVNDPFKSWCGRFGIRQINTLGAHPHANGLVEKANRSLIEGIKTRLGREKAGWVDELPNVLWAHRTSIKQSNGETPFSLTYGSEAVIPAEICIPIYRTLMIREAYNEE